MSEENVATAQPDAMAVLRSRSYLKGLVLAGVLGVPISAIAYGFLALVQQLQEWFYSDVPSAFGFDSTPAWWPIPLLGIAGLLVAATIKYLPGTSGHSPANGLATGGYPQGAELIGVVLAPLAGLSLGIVLGPEAPLIALGGGLGALAVRLIAKDTPPSGAALIAAAGSFAAISTLLGSPILGAFLLIEASGIAGAMLGVALLPGLLASGVGFLIFTGLDAVTGLGTFSLTIPNLPEFTTPTIGQFGWAVVIGLLCPFLAWSIQTGAQSLRPFVHRNRLAVTVVLGLAVGSVATLFATITGEDTSFVLFSGQNEMGPLVLQAASWSAATLVLLVIAKSLAYLMSLSAFRGGPVFPAMFIGTAIGLLASQLPGMELVPAIGIGMGAMTVSMLRLPFSSVMLATILLSSSGVAVVSLVIVAVVVSYVVVSRLPVIVHRDPEPLAAATSS